MPLSSCTVFRLRNKQEPYLLPLWSLRSPRVLPVGFQHVIHSVLPSSVENARLLPLAGLLTYSTQRCTRPASSTSNRGRFVPLGSPTVLCGGVVCCSSTHPSADDIPSRVHVTAAGKAAEVLPVDRAATFRLVFTEQLHSSCTSQHGRQSHPNTIAGRYYPLLPLHGASPAGVVPSSFLTTR